MTEYDRNLGAALTATTAVQDVTPKAPGYKKRHSLTLYRPKTKLQRQQLAAELERMTNYPTDVQRPTNRLECKGGKRPCPWVSCRYHLYLDVRQTGNLLLNFPGVELEDLAATCALDVADGEPQQYEQIAKIMHASKQLAHAIEKKALAKCGRSDLRLRGPLSDHYEDQE